MFASFAFAFYTLTPTYFQIRIALNSTANSVVTDVQGLTTIHNVTNVFGHLWAWVAVLGAAFILIWAYVYSTKKDYESVLRP